jgi:hypothetical protein
VVPGAATSWPVSTRERVWVRFGGVDHAAVGRAGRRMW